MKEDTHEWSGDLCLIRLPKAILILSRAEYVRALKRGKGYLRARQREKAIERGKIWAK